MNCVRVVCGVRRDRFFIVECKSDLVSDIADVTGDRCTAWIAG